MFLRILRILDGEGRRNCYKVRSETSFKCGNKRSKSFSWAWVWAVKTSISTSTTIKPLRRFHHLGIDLSIVSWDGFKNHWVSYALIIQVIGHGRFVWDVLHAMRFALICYNLFMKYLPRIISSPIITKRQWLVDAQSKACVLLSFSTNHSGKKNMTPRKTLSQKIKSSQALVPRR